MKYFPVGVIIYTLICVFCFDALVKQVFSGWQDGHLKMLGGYLEFFMKPAIAEMYQSLRRELDELIQNKVSENLKICYLCLNRCVLFLYTFWLLSSLCSELVIKGGTRKFLFAWLAHD